MKCSVRGCNSPQRGAGWCGKHGTAKADAEWAWYVRHRDAGCMAAHYYPDIECAGHLQAMHLVSRRYHVTRWTPINGAAGCGAHHRYLTEHPEHHVEFCRAHVGVEQYEEIRQTALHGVQPRMDDVFPMLRQLTEGMRE